MSPFDEDPSENKSEKDLCIGEIHALQSQLTIAEQTIKHLRDKAEFDMPEEMHGHFYNACTDPCDMVDGPCACGAMHNVKEWLEKLNSKLNTAKKENQAFGDVLAVIHRDGGHYIVKHGAEKASEDAIAIVLKLRENI